MARNQMSTPGRMFPLVIGERERAALADLVARAAASPTDHATQKRLAEAHARGQGGLGALNRALTVELPVGYTVTMTHEEHRPGVMCRHASIGLRTAPGRGPTPEAVAMILEALGFVNRLGAAATWLETLDDGTICPNVLEPLDGEMARLRRGA
jgi:hypothetical protein